MPYRKDHDRTMLACSSHTKTLIKHGAALHGLTLRAYTDCILAEYVRVANLALMEQPATRLHKTIGGGKMDGAGFLAALLEDVDETANVTGSQ